MIDFFAKCVSWMNLEKKDEPELKLTEPARWGGGSTTITFPKQEDAMEWLGQLKLAPFGKQVYLFQNGKVVVGRIVGYDFAVMAKVEGEDEQPEFDIDYVIRTSPEHSFSRTLVVKEFFETRGDLANALIEKVYEGVKKSDEAVDEAKAKIEEKKLIGFDNPTAENT